MGAQPRVLQDGKTPAQWVTTLADAGIEISERALREHARRLGACRVLGNAMILMPEHIDQIFEEPKWREPSSENTSAGGRGGLKGASKASITTTEKALEHLMRQSQKRKSTGSRGKPGNVLSLASMRRAQKTS